MSDAEQQVATVPETAEPVYPNLVGGSRKGVPNKTTQAMRDLCRSFTEDRYDAFLACFDRLAAKSPSRAVTAYLKALELMGPKSPSGFAIEAATTTNREGHSVTALRLRSMLETQ